MVGIILAFFSGAFYSLSYVFVQKGMRQDKQGDNGLFINLALNVVFLSLVYLIMLIFREEPVEWSLYGILAFVLAGLLASFVGRATLFAGIRHIGSSRAVGIKNSAPVVTILIAVLFLEEQITIWSGLGILIILLGLFLFIREQWFPGGEGTTRGWVGFILAGISAVCFGAGQVVRKLGIAVMPDPVLGSLLGTGVALLLYGIITLSRKSLRTGLMDQIKNLNLYYILSSISICLGLLSFFVAILFTQVAYVSAVAGIEPVLTVLLASFLLKKQEILDRNTVVSAVLVFSGIVIMALSSVLVN